VSADQSSSAARHPLPQGVNGGPSSGLRPPSPARGEGERAAPPRDSGKQQQRLKNGRDEIAASPSPLAGEGGRRPDEGNRHHAKAMRKSSTEAERALWYMLRSRRFSGYKFRRQVPIGRYVVDFICFEKRLIVEADGSQHAESEHDRRRDEWLAAQGFRVLRFWNFNIMTDREMVAETLWQHLEGQLA
jgi:very-short-patch-repair endonuclease